MRGPNARKYAFCISILKLHGSNAIRKNTLLYLCISEWEISVKSHVLYVLQSCRTSTQPSSSSWPLDRDHERPAPLIGRPPPPLLSSRQIQSRVCVWAVQKRVMQDEFIDAAFLVFFILLMTTHVESLLSFNRKRFSFHIFISNLESKLVFLYFLLHFLLTFLFLTLPSSSYFSSSSHPSISVRERLALSITV